MGMLDTFKSDSYTDGRTKQAFKDECDINKILARSAAGHTISHLERHGGHYADYSDIGDLLEAHAKIQRGQQIFNDLPGEVKREFSNSPQAFFEFVNDPANSDRLAEVLPQLAQPGNQLPQVTRTAKSEGVESAPIPGTAAGEVDGPPGGTAPGGAVSEGSP